MHSQGHDFVVLATLQQFEGVARDSLLLTAFGIIGVQEIPFPGVTALVGIFIHS